MYDKVKLLISSDTSVCLEFGDEISEDINKRIRAFGILLDENPIEGISETVPTYRSVLIHYHPGVISYGELRERLLSLIENIHEMEIPASEIVDVPVLYGGEFGPDLEYVAKYHNMTPEEVVRIHTAPKYLIYMLGFTPGFSYMGGMDKRIATPRLKTPRVRIPGGSVGIAGVQTGIYPLDSPGGWQLIGRTPLVLYDHTREQPVLFNAGQRVRFRAIDKNEFDRIAAHNGGAV